MRADLMSIAVAALAVSFDHVVTAPSADRAAGMQLAQTGPLATPALNPGLGAAPPGGHMAGSVESARDAVPGGALPANPAGRLGTVNGDHLGVPGAGAVPAAPGGAVPPAAAGAVPPAAAGAVPPPAGGAVAPPAAGAIGR